ncbi:MAG TPA: hypothetical protein ENI33_08210 [Thermoplasmatales archaeon]|nr:hypothetical protein [Thermoplasmatales archaeon]
MENFDVIDFNPPKSWLVYEINTYKNYVSSFTEFSIFAEDEEGEYNIHFLINGPEKSKFYLYGKYYHCNGTGYTGNRNMPVSFQLRDEKGHAPEGIYTVEFWAEDALGNVEEKNIKEFIIDTKSPGTEIEFNNKFGEFISPFIEISFKYIDGDFGVKNTLYKIDDEAWKYFLRPFKIGGEGKHTICYYSY